MKQLFHQCKNHFTRHLENYGIGLLAVLIGFNQFIMMDIGKAIGIKTPSLNIKKVFSYGSSAASGGDDATFAVPKSGDTSSQAIAAMIKQGVPEVYGAALGVSYDNPAQDINKLAAFDTSIDTNTLTAEEKSRYINIAGRISCEFCCGAKSVIYDDGRAACGCAHSAAFRGLAKYLLKNNPNWSNDRILKELTFWKSLFYPKNMVEKAMALINNNMPLTVNALNDNDLLKKIQKGDTGSVGSGQLPEMVGGC